MANILIIDDEEEIRNVSSYILQAEGYLVDTASDGHEAIQKATKQEYDLALVDLVLPGGLNGLDIISKLKEISSATRIIAFTGFSGANIAEKTSRAGADGFITKPFLSQGLIQTVHKWISSKNNSNVTKNPEEQVVRLKRKHVKPKIFEGFSDEDTQNFINLGKINILGSGIKLVANYRNELVIIQHGQAQCYYKNVLIDTLHAGDTIGEACIFLRKEMDIPVTLETNKIAELLIISKSNMKSFFTNNHPKLFLRFSANIIINLSRKLIHNYDEIIDYNVKN